MRLAGKVRRGALIREEVLSANAKTTMAQTSLRQFYTVRKRPHAEHGSVKRRKLTTDTRLDIPVLEEGAEPLSIPISQAEKVSTSLSSHTVAQEAVESNSTAPADSTQVPHSSLLSSVPQRKTR